MGVPLLKKPTLFWLVRKFRIQNWEFVKPCGEQLMHFIIITFFVFLASSRCVATEWKRNCCDAKYSHSNRHGNKPAITNELSLSVWLCGSLERNRISLPPPNTQLHTIGNFPRYNTRDHWFRLRSREYRFTYMNCSTVDIPFLSEALSGEIIWVILKVAEVTSKEKTH